MTRKKGYRTEVWIPRTGEWTVVDICYPIQGRRQMSLATYEKAVLRAFPVLKTRTRRTDVFWAEPVKSGDFNA